MIWKETNEIAIIEIGDACGNGNAELLLYEEAIW